QRCGRLDAERLHAGARLLAGIEADHAVAAAHQALCHVRAHLAQPDHAQFHLMSSFCNRWSEADAPVAMMPQPAPAMFVNAVAARGVPGTTPAPPRRWPTTRWGRGG